MDLFQPAALAKLDADHLGFECGEGCGKGFANHTCSQRCTPRQAVEVGQRVVGRVGFGALDAALDLANGVEVLADLLAVGGTETVTLAKPLPLHIVYQTAWLDEDGTPQFRDDIYGWDKQTPAADANTVAEPCGS